MGKFAVEEMGPMTVNQLVVWLADMTAVQKDHNLDFSMAAMMVS